MPIGLGSTFLNSQGRNLPIHLWVVISDPDSSQRVVIANLTSCRGAEDDNACLFNSGDHPFIHHTTYVNYADARIVSLIKLEELVRLNLMKPHADVSDEFLDRIWQGATRSRFTNNEILEFLRSQNLI